MGVYRRHNCDNPSCSKWRRGPGACDCGGQFVPGPWCIEYLHKGRRRTEKVAGSRAMANNVLMKRQKAGPIQRLPLKSLWEKFIKTRKGNTERVERAYWKLRLGQWFGEEDALRLSRQDLLEYVEARRRDGVKDSTIGREIAILRGMWSFATMEGWVSHNPFLKLGVSAKKREPINKYLLQSEWERLYEYLPKPTKDYYLFLWETAARSSEAMNLKWDRIDFDRKLAWVKGKGKGMEPLFLSERVMDMLQKREKKEYVFTNRYGKKVAAPRLMLVEAAEKSGLNEELRQTGRSAINGPHYLRHAAISRWVMQGEDLAVVMRLARHTSVEMTMRYTHLAPEKLHGAVNK